MGKWEMVRLGDVASINPNVVHSISVDSTVSILPMDAVSVNGEITYHQQDLLQNIKKGLTTFQNGDILFAKITPCMENGKCCIAKNLKNGVGFGSTEFHVIRPSKAILPIWLFRLIHSDTFRRLASQNMTGSAGQKRVPASFLKNHTIPLPPLPIQQKIADVLDRAAALIEKRKAQIEKLDLLVKSQFIEMFGDPVTNPKGWQVRKLYSLTSKITDGVHLKPNYVEIGVPFISVVNITKGYVDFNNCKFVSQQDYEKMIRSTCPEFGDILYTKVGATYGIPAYINTNVKFCLYVSVCLIKPKHEQINAKFLSLSMGMPYIKRQADNRIKGIGVPDLHLNQIREFDIICPPLPLQNTFANFVNRVEAQKSLLQSSLAKLELNYKSLMQKCFNGEVF